MARIAKQTPNIFVNAQVVESKKPASKSKAPELPVVGIAEYAAYCSVIDTVTGLKEAKKKEICDVANGLFLNEIRDTKRKPTNFRGVEGNASGSIQFKKRSTVSALTDEQASVLDEFKIPYETVADRPSTFIIGEEYAQDADVLGKLNKAIAPLIAKGELPANVIQKQEATTKRVVTDDTLDAVCKIEDMEALAALVPVVSSTAINPTTTDDIVTCLAHVIECLGANKEQARSALEKALKAYAVAA